MRTLSNEIADYGGKEVELAGWVDTRRDHGKLVFIDLRDRAGVVQVVFSATDKALREKADRLRSEWVVRVKGEVRKRPKGTENEKLESGTYEVAASVLEVLAEAKTPPFDLAGSGLEVSEDVRMQYRYLDLRRPRLQKNIRIRSKILGFIRGFFGERDFVEVETPILGKSTPEGARDYLVPSRLQAGMFYALPQSPQQYKQLLMVAGMERYFQVARCFRDEDTRGDRQPEFTQLDIELSFTNEEEVLALVEEFYVALVKKCYPQKKIAQTPFPRLTYQSVMERYRSDKPDLRVDKNNPDELAFAFVTNFPMFEWKVGEKRWDAVHHPFTMPRVMDVNDFKIQFREGPSKITARQYDVVLNGFEIGGGSIRIHQAGLLQAVFEAMGNKSEEVREKFGHMLEAFDYGVPPHGGVALGLDRLFAALENEPSIREVIAFPKTGDGRDLLMGAPAGVNAKQLRELHIEVTNGRDAKKKK